MQGYFSNKLVDGGHVDIDKGIGQGVRKGTTGSIDLMDGGH